MVNVVAQELPEVLWDYSLKWRPAQPEQWQKIGASLMNLGISKSIAGRILLLQKPLATRCHTQRFYVACNACGVIYNPSPWVETRVAHLASCVHAATPWDHLGWEALGCYSCGVYASHHSSCPFHAERFGSVGGAGVLLTGLPTRPFSSKDFQPERVVMVHTCGRRVHLRRLPASVADAEDFGTCGACGELECGPSCLGDALRVRTLCDDIVPAPPADKPTDSEDICARALFENAHWHETWDAHSWSICESRPAHILAMLATNVSESSAECQLLSKMSWQQSMRLLKLLKQPILIQGPWPVLDPRLELAAPTDRVDALLLYGGITRALSAGGKWKEALQVLDCMAVVKLVPDERIYVNLWQVFSQADQWQSACELLEWASGNGITGTKASLRPDIQSHPRPSPWLLARGEFHRQRHAYRGGPDHSGWEVPGLSSWRV